MTECVLCVDLGAGSLRTGVVTAHGRLGATAAAPMTVAEPQPG